MNPKLESLPLITNPEAPEEDEDALESDDPLARVEAAPPSILALRQKIFRLRGGQKLRAILDLPDPNALLASLPPQELLWTLKDIGLADASELLLATPVEQIRFCLDLDIWRKDKILPEQLQDWFQPLLARDFETAEHILKAIDQDTLQLFLRSLIRVHQVNEDDEVPEDIDGEWMQTPDRIYLIEILYPADEPRNLLARSILELFFAYGPTFCTPMFEVMRHNLPSHLEEAAYHFHKARMEDLGFIDYYEAIAIYQPLTSARLPSASTAPLISESLLPIVSLPPTSGLFSKALSAITEPSHQRRIRTELIHLTNKLLVADQADLSDPHVAEATLRLALQTLDLGLERLASSSLDDPSTSLLLHSVEGLFRFGFSALALLRRRAALLFKRDDLSLQSGLPLSLLTDDERDFLEALRLLKPRLHTAFLGEGTGIRPFRNLRDIQNAEDFLAYLEWLPALLFDLLGFSRSVLLLQLPDLLSPAEPSEIRSLHLVLTALANFTLYQRFTPEPLLPSDLPLLLASWFEPSSPPRPLRSSFQTHIEHSLIALAPDPSARPHLQRLLSSVWLTLSDHLSSLDPAYASDPRYLSLFLFRRPS